VSGIAAGAVWQTTQPPARSSDRRVVEEMPSMCWTWQHSATDVRRRHAADTRRRSTIRRALGAGAVGLLAAASAPAEVDIVFWPAAQSIGVGETALVGVYLFTDDEVGEAVSAAQVAFVWDDSVVQLDGLSAVGAVPLLLSGFPLNAPGGFNEANPPQDGDGMYVAWALLGTPVIATVSGTLLTTMKLVGLAPGTSTAVEPVSAGGLTKVVSGTVPGLVVTGTLTGCVVTVACSDVFADLDCDGAVDGADMGLLLGTWDTAGELAPSPDLDGSGLVDGGDLGLLIAAWSV